MSKQIAAIVIPVYKDSIDKNEEKSLLQCFKILGSYPIIFACGKGLNTKCYTDLCRSNQIKEQWVRFEDYYFQSIPGYCRLLLSAKFFRQFKDFEFILLYQLDAYVFKNELEAWCNKGFAYIGAPWFEGQDKSKPDAPFMSYAGNGGFSLRHVSESLRIIRTYKIIKPPAGILIEYNHFSAFSKLLRLPVIMLRFLGFRNNSIYQRAQYSLNEDNYWAFLAPAVSSSFKVATSEEAVGFAFEFMPRRMYALNNYQLPFGCHAWWKYDLEFWKQFIN